ncbi:MAG TPA: hypothetical protein VK667_04890, partial [Ktedonobacteraceae bacterium]|nr:hypothetical protein [Ktedonobacteraceae bacterium]
MKDALMSSAIETLRTISLRCVECSTLYPGMEAGWKPRYRCDCGGVLDVELAPPTGAIGLRQLFDERASAPPTWPVNTGNILPDHSGV